MAVRAPIGVFDSGVGGLSVLRAIRQALPHEDLHYIADSAFVPYGGRSEAEILERSRLMTRFLVERGVKAIVIACNTATAAAAIRLREEFALPIVAMEPALKPAVAATRSGVVGVLATPGTLGSRRFASLVERYGRSATVITQPCVGWVELVESGELEGPVTDAALERYLRPLLESRADTLMLGCAPYPFLRPAMERLLQGEVGIIDTGPAVARQLYRVLAEQGLLRGDGEGREYFWTSGDATKVQPVVDVLWPRRVPVQSASARAATEDFQ